MKHAKRTSRRACSARLAGAGKLTPTDVAAIDVTESGEPVEVGAEEEAMLLVAIAQADRDETVPAAEVLACLRKQRKPRRPRATGAA